MPSIIFSHDILGPVPDTVIKKLRRRHSAPELFMSGARSRRAHAYFTGSFLRLQLDSGSQNLLTVSVAQAEIIKTFKPFTMAPVMVVRICEPALNLEGDFVLKPYDRCALTEGRRDKRIRKCGITSDGEFEKRRWNKDLVQYFDKPMAHSNLHYNLQDEDEDEEDDDDDQ